MCSRYFKNLYSEEQQGLQACFFIKLLLLDALFMHTVQTKQKRNYFCKDIFRGDKGRQVGVKVWQQIWRV